MKNYTNTLENILVTQKHFYRLIRFIIRVGKGSLFWKAYKHLRITNYKYCKVTLISLLGIYKDWYFKTV